MGNLRRWVGGQVRTEEQILADFIRTLADHGFDFEALPPNMRIVLNASLQTMIENERLLDEMIEKLVDAQRADSGDAKP